MNRAWLLAGSSALIGGVAGAAVATRYLTEDAASTAGAPAAAAQELGAAGRSAPDAQQLASRLEALERSLRELEHRQTSPPPHVPVTAASAGMPEPAPILAAPADPVFEAAVLDIIERAEEGRDSERDTKRDERARERAEAWANELTMRIGLSPAQTARLVEIQTQLRDELRARRSDAPTGKYISKEQRRAAVQAVRLRAEQDLREVLEPNQANEYDKLDSQLKIVRSDDD
jgi:hypothetical protein